MQERTTPKAIRPAVRVLSLTRDFLATEAAGGILLMGAAALAMIVANSPLAHGYFEVLHFETGPVLSAKLGPMSVHLWINDALMAVFFLLVGLEIKREVVDGGLSSAERRRLPLIAAAAGMLVPMLVYFAVAGGHPELHRGWAIPAATDIAFAIGVLALLGDRVPASLKLLLTALAIVDDMGAVAIIAVGYTEGLNLPALAAAAGIALTMWGMNRGRVTALWPYLIGFALLWLAMLISGVHATIAGVVAALTIPITTSPAAPDDAHSPLHRLEHALHPWVAYLIVPLFGFANAGVSLSGMSLATLGEPLVLAILLGLFVGKQVGILGGIALAVKLKVAPRPRGCSWRQLYGMALVAGIGFTMSLFIGGLAFKDPLLQDEVKVGVLAGSLLSALLGVIVLLLGKPVEKARPG
ncbi:Na+/H+ antiporter NhaA [Sphingomonas sp. DT-204]|uniref:Na+/H+ antiporter NhaA n=1 Tax=Sphingomonas sp. DT-204 TaxID=3396166 RepID=UPI003F1DCB04